MMLTTRKPSSFFAIVSIIAVASPKRQVNLTAMIETRISESQPAPVGMVAVSPIYPVSPMKY